MIETRISSTASAAGLRLASPTIGTSAVIEGYAAVFHRASDPGTEYKLRVGNAEVLERIKPTAFDNALRFDDVRCCFNHSPSEILGRTSSGTMRLSVDSIGLRFTTTLPESASRVREAIARRDVTGCSVQFTVRPGGVVYRDERIGNRIVTVRELVDLQLVECGRVCHPAYSGTSVDLAGEPPPSRTTDPQLAARLTSIKIRARLCELGLTGNAY